LNQINILTQQLTRHLPAPQMSRRNICTTCDGPLPPISSASSINNASCASVRVAWLFPYSPAVRVIFAISTTTLAVMSGYAVADAQSSSQNSGFSSPPFSGTREVADVQGFAQCLSFHRWSRESHDNIHSSKAKQASKGRQDSAGLATAKDSQGAGA
jgi:hypothetical protein